MRYDSDIQRARYAFTQTGGKYHIADRRGVAYLCDCASECIIEHRLGIGFGNRFRFVGSRVENASKLWDRLDAHPERSRGPW